MKKKYQIIKTIETNKMNSDLTTSDLSTSKFAPFMDPEVKQQCEKSMEGLGAVSRYKLAFQMVLFYSCILRETENDDKPTKSTKKRRRDEGEKTEKKETGEIDDLNDPVVVRKYMTSESFDKRIKTLRNKRRAVSALYKVPQSQLKMDKYSDETLKFFVLNWSSEKTFDDVVNEVEEETRKAFYEDTREEEDEEDEEDEDDDDSDDSDEGVLRKRVKALNNE